MVDELSIYSCEVHTAAEGRHDALETWRRFRSLSIDPERPTGNGSSSHLPDHGDFTLSTPDGVLAAMSGTVVGKVGGADGVIPTLLHHASASWRLGIAEALSARLREGLTDTNTPTTWSHSYGGYLARRKAASSAKDLREVTLLSSTQMPPSQRCVGWPSTPLCTPKQGYPTQRRAHGV